MTFGDKLKLLGVCAEAQDTALAAYDKLKGHAEFFALRGRIEKREDFGGMEGDCKALAGRCGVRLFELYFALLTECVDIMRDAYLSAGYDEVIFTDALADFGAKLSECKAVYGYYGIWPFLWYPWYYQGRRFQFGRLQFELIELSLDVPEHGLKKGDTVINIHIPSGAPITPDAVDSSLSRAREFFAGKADKFVCSSWLLYPNYRKVFAEGSNTRAFIDRFDVVKTAKQERFEDAWRVFSVSEITDVEALPQDTSMRRAFVEYIKNVDEYGTGMGIMK